MSEDIAFRIQLGIILPKLKDKVAGDISSILEELVTIVQAGTLGDEEVSLESVKEIFMKDLEIFLDDAIFPAIEQKLNPIQDAPDEAAEESGEQAEGAEDAEDTGTQ